MEYCLQELVYDSKLVKDIQGGDWTLSVYHDLDGVGNQRYRLGVGDMSGMKYMAGEQEMWMGAEVTDMDRCGRYVWWQGI